MCVTAKWRDLMYRVSPISDHPSVSDRSQTKWQLPLPLSTPIGPIRSFPPDPR